MPRITPAIITATTVAVVIAILSSSLRFVMAVAGLSPGAYAYLVPAVTPWPFHHRAGAAELICFFFGLLLIAAAVSGATWLGVRGSRGRYRFWPVGLSSWLGAILGGWLSGILDGVIIVPSYAGHFEPAGMLVSQVLSTVNSGALWGFATGWVIGLGAGIAYLAAVRGHDIAAPGSPASGVPAGPAISGPGS